MLDECGKLFGGLWNLIFTNFHFGTEFVMGGGGGGGNEPATFQF
jgi:hypothetical protein